MADKELLEALHTYLDKHFSGMYVGDYQLSLDTGVCYTVSWVASRILKNLGYNCMPKRVTFIIGDEIGREIYLKQRETGKFDKQEVIDAGGWTIGLGFYNEKEKVDDHHWIIWFPDEEEIMDLTIGQAKRPGKNIAIKHFWCYFQDMPEEIVDAGFVVDNKPHSHQIKNVPKVKEYLRQVIKNFDYKRWRK